MRKIIGLCSAALVLVAIAATPAWAGPTRSPSPASAFDLPDIFCGFAVHVEFPKNREYSLTYTDDDGNVTLIRTTGAFAVSLTNLENGHSADFNISGPGSLVPHEDGSATLYASGTWLFPFAPDQLGPGTPGQLTLYIGHTVLWFDANGFDQRIVSFSGRTSDVCAALA
jgi:hypothetical protein